MGLTWQETRASNDIGLGISFVASEAIVGLTLLHAINISKTKGHPDAGVSYKSKTQFLDWLHKEPLAISVRFFKQRGVMRQI